MFADVSLSVHLWQPIIIVIYRFNADIEAYMHAASNTTSRLHAYPATVDTVFGYDTSTFALRTSLY